MSVPLGIPVPLPIHLAESTYWEGNLWSYGQVQMENMDLLGLQTTEA
jgi:hypothetical protein